MVTCDVVLRGLRLDAASGARLVAGGAVPGRPLIVKRTDPDFIEALLRELATAEGRAKLAGMKVRAPAAGVLHLYQPVHRTFYLLLLEACCRLPGEPRLDPSRLEGAGVVVRRVPVGQPTDAAPEAWRSGGGVEGWVPLGAADGDADPDVARRPPRFRTGHAALDRIVRAAGVSAEPMSETVVPLFTAPGDVCAAAGRTILYALIPTASTEIGAAPAALREARMEASTAEALLPSFLRAGPVRTPPLPGDVLTAESVETHRRNIAFRAFLEELSTLHALLDLTASDGPGSELIRRLNDLRAPMNQHAVIRSPLTEHLAQWERVGVLYRLATRVLVDQEPGVSFRMPLRWPAMPAAVQTLALQRIRSESERRLALLAPDKPRFDEPGHRYRARAFVRVGCRDGCPPKLVWSEPSDPYHIVPWFEPGEQPPVQIRLPDPTDRAALKRLRPSVAFVAPASMLNAMKATKLPDILIGRKGPPGPSLSLDWILGFSIPIITTCALIVMYIFLNLLNIIFRWLPYVLVLVPVPRVSGSPPAPPPPPAGGGA